MKVAAVVARRYVPQLQHLHTYIYRESEMYDKDKTKKTERQKRDKGGDHGS